MQPRVESVTEACGAAVTARAKRRTTAEGGDGGAIDTLYSSFESNIGPKLDYLQSAASLTLSELRGRVIAFPTILTHSTAQRCQPRYAAGRAAGVDAAAVLATIAKGDAEFGAQLDRRRELLSAKA